MTFLGGLFGNSNEDRSAPIALVFKSASKSGVLNTGALSSATTIAKGLGDLLSGGSQIKLFDSYSFERNMLSPGTAFRFTAPGLDHLTRMSIRSGDMVQLLATDRNGKQIPIATGFVDETDTHISAGRVEFVVTGRDTLGQLIDNAAIDSHNKVVNTKKMRMESIFALLISNTRMPQEFDTQQLDNGTLLFQTNPGETKMNTLQRYMEITNTLVWSNPNGQATLGKPNFLNTTPPTGVLTVGSTGSGDFPKLPSIGGVTPQSTNVLDCRVKRNLNNAIRQIVNQMQNQEQADAGRYTLNNQDSEMKALAGSGVGRSVYRIFSFGAGAEAANFIKHVGNIPGIPSNWGAGYSYREIARENVQILELEITVQGHLNSNGNVYDVDQIYYCNVPDENISENMYVYAVNHELTLDHGMITKLRLCKLGTIVAGTYQAPVPSIL